MDEVAIYSLDTVKLEFLAESQSTFRISFFLTLSEPRRIKLEFQILWDKSLDIETPPVLIMDSRLNSGRMYFEILHSLKKPGPLSLPPGSHEIAILIDGENATSLPFKN